MILVFTLMTTLMGTILKADEATCREVLKKCDLALHAQIEVNKTQEQIIQDQIELIVIQKDQLESQGIWKSIAIGGAVVIVIETLVLVLRK